MGRKRPAPVKASLRSRWRERFRAWVNRRIPPARAITLDQKRIFIFPSRVGLFFGLSLLVMLMTAINYQNNMSYALTFLLATLFIVATLHTYANLSGLTIRAMRARPAYPGQHTEFDLQIERSKQREHYALHVTWPESTSAMVNLLNEDQVVVQLHTAVGQRGWYSPGRLLVESTWPLGLLRCWTWVDLDLYALVYPHPLPCAEPSGVAADNPDGGSAPVVGNEDFYGFRDYRAGDSPRRIHWKGVARGQGVKSKYYAAHTQRSAWLDWDMFPGIGTEQRLSQLCYLALDCDARGDDYGLMLPGCVIKPAHGEAHRDAVLKALATYGIGEPRT